MRQAQPSLTALGIATMRAVESEKPEGERICYDPYARRFVPTWLYLFLRFFIQSGYTERRGPGVNTFLAARERYIDDVLKAYLAEGLEQLVILGAGYDARAYRIDGLQGRVKVFEVDHPATQQDKLGRLKKIFGRIPEGVIFVPVDFNRQTLADRLPESGYELDRKTLFIWQGVAMYLTAEAVDATLAFVAQNSPAGSAIVFDYLYQAVLDGRQKQNEVTNMRRYRFMTGEGLIFGIPEGGVGAFLQARSFGLVRDVHAADLSRAYCVGANAGRRMAGGYGIALGVVVSRS